MEGTSRKGNSVLIWSITAHEGYLRRLTTSTQLNTRISHMNLFQGYVVVFAIVVLCHTNRELFCLGHY
jgi:hypothetical protein